MTKEVTSDQVEVKINAKEVTLNWQGYDVKYNAEDQTDAIQVSYTDVLGNEISVAITLTKNGGFVNKGDIVKFLYYGEYLATATITDPNYFTNNSTLTITMDADYVAEINAIKYRTIEEAICQAKSGEQIILLASTKFVDADLCDESLAPANTYTLNGNLLLPYKEGDKVGHTGNGEDSGDMPVSGSGSVNPQLYLTLTIPTGIILNVSDNSTLTVGAIRGLFNSGGNPQNMISGGYSRLILDGTIISTGTVESYGEIKGNGKIIANGGIVRDMLVITGWRGGSNAKDVYQSGFPFNDYEVRSIEPTIEIHYGARLVGHARITTTKKTIAFFTFNPQVNDADLGLVGTEDAMLILKDSDAYVTRSFVNGKSQMEIYGNATTSYGTLKLTVAAMTSISITTEKLFFPINHNVNMILKKGCNLDLVNKFKFLTGSGLTIEEGATLNINQGGELIFYKEFNDNSTTGGVPYGKYAAATLVNDGTIYVSSNGKIAAAIGATEGSTTGKVIVESGATLKIDSIEKDRSNSLTISVSSSLVSSSGEIALEAGTYVFNGDTWNKETE